MNRFFFLMVLALAALLGAAGTTMVAPGGAHAQISSPAFDPNCYQPQIGVPNEIDTIYGSHTNQGLGGNQIGIGPPPGGGYNRVLFMGYPNNPNQNKPNGFDMVQGGPFLDIHNQNQPNAGFFPVGYYHAFGHFHDPSHTDLLYYREGLAIIYWSDSNGLYDSARYTALEWNSPDPTNNGGFPEGYQPYIAKLTNDSVDDIALIFFARWVGSSAVNDSDWLVLFKGGEHLYSQGDTARNDEATPLGPPGQYPSSIIPECVGDFRGTGRKGVISYDEVLNSNGNGTTATALYYYKNDFTFSTDRYVYAMTHDTLSDSGQWGWPFGGAKIFPKARNDSSEDFWMGYHRQDDPPGDYASLNFYRGGPSFGTRRVTLDDTDFCLRSPEYYDFGWSSIDVGGTLLECGDMTGTGNPVILVPGGDPETAYNFYYVMGTATDPWVDMYYSQYYGWPMGLDTITADGDKYQDIIRGNSFYRTQGGTMTGVGTIHVIHGSSRIPVTPNSRFSAVNRFSASSDSMTVADDPTGVLRIALFLDHPQSLTIKIFNMLGKNVLEGREFAHGTEEVFEFPVPTLASGAYALEAIGEADANHSSFAQTKVFSIVR